MRSTLFLALFFLASYASAQSVKTYLTAEDYFAGSAASAGAIKISTKQLAAVPGEYTYYVSAKNSELDLNIKKKYWAIERNDSLFLNCNRVFNTRERNKRSRNKIWFRNDVYAYVLFRWGDQLHFRAGRTNLPGVPPSRYDATESAMVNVLNEAMEPEEEQQRFNYLYDNNIKDAVYLNRGVMRRYHATAVANKDTAFAKYLKVLIAKEK